MTGSGTALRLAEARQVRVRRARALARLADRRAADEQALARAQAMARHPAGRRRSTTVVDPIEPTSRPELRLVT